jgi:hypothetical protein
MTEIDTSAEATAQVVYQLRYLPGTSLVDPQTREDFAKHVAALAAERDALREAGLDALASLVAAHSLLKAGGKKAAPSDKMFEQMLRDYEASIQRARAVLAQKEPGA